MAWDVIVMDERLHFDCRPRGGCSSRNVEYPDISFKFLGAGGALSMGWDAAMGVKGNLFCNAELLGVANPN